MSDKVNISVGPLTVTNDDGSAFLSVKGIEYFGVPRDSFAVMESDLLALFQKLNSYDQQAQAEKKKVK
jgi:hypothetical protein